MVSASLLVEARRRAGLSQRELGVRAGVAQQEIARYERGGVTPSLERLRTLIAACGLELTFGLTRADDSYDEQIAAALALSPAQRLERALSDAEPMRAAGAEPPPAVAGVGVLRALNAAGVRYVLVGDMAEALHGSPLLTMSNAVTIVPRPGQGEALRAAISAAGGHQATAPVTSTIDAPLRWTLKSHGAELVVVPAPPATHGYEDLHRDATQTSVDDDVVVEVASLVDLVRIAQAGEDPARVPALRRTLELADAARDPATRAA